MLTDGFSLMERLLSELFNETNLCQLNYLQRLITHLRPSKATASAEANQKLLALNHLLSKNSVWAEALKTYLLTVLAHYKLVHLYTDMGVLTSEGFAKSFNLRLSWKLLPPAVNSTHLKDVFGQIFTQQDDYLWLRSLEPQHLQECFDLLFATKHTPELVVHQQKSIRDLLDAILVISYRITAMGLEPELVGNHPTIEDYDSPFLAQNREATDFIEAYKCFLEGTSPAIDDQQLCVLLAQCSEIVEKIRKNAKTNGITIDLTYLLQRLEQHIARLHQLLSIICESYTIQRDHILELIIDLVEAENTKLSIRKLCAQNIQLLSRQITDNASKTGEHYVTTDKAGFLLLLKSTMGAGLIIPLMALIKILTQTVKLAPFGQAFFYSLNYSFGFMLIHLLHFTVATKQPAMTAANMAATIEQAHDKKTQNLMALSELTVNTIRSQFIAIMGNISVAFPIAYIVSWAWHNINDEHIINTTKAASLLHDLNPFTSLALFHAAIAGVCLFLAGLISGYYDNKAVYHRIGERLRQRPKLIRLFGESRLLTLTQYIENNLGALAGNFYFGLMLGSIGTIGFILGLPIDIRHIAFSAANFAYAIVAFEHQLSWQTYLVTAIGIFLIGVTNLMVSFSLALFVALKARGVRFAQWWPLLCLLGQHLRHHPRDFFWPASAVNTTATSEKSEDSNQAKP